MKTAATNKTTTSSKTTTKTTKTTSPQKKTALQKFTNFFTHDIHVSALKLGISILVLGVIGIGIWQLKVYYRGKILPKVKVAGVKVGGKTPIEAQKNRSKLY